MFNINLPSKISKDIIPIHQLAYQTVLSLIYWDVNQVKTLFVELKYQNAYLINDSIKDNINHRHVEIYNFSAIDV